MAEERAQQRGGEVAGQQEEPDRGAAARAVGDVDDQCHETERVAEERDGLDNDGSGGCDWRVPGFFSAL